MKIISVVRDFDMYNRLVRDNKFNQGCDFIYYDNNKENVGIATRYNSFLDVYDFSYSEWLVFCHEDWEIKENWQKRLEKLDKNCIYGPIGTQVTECHSIYHDIYKAKIYGEITNSEKDGQRPIWVGIKVFKPIEVDTFDCQCMIIHTDLIKKHNLRFDDKLLWDLYVEDFCINAKENYNVKSMVLQLKCQHYSYGNIEQRYYDGIKYLQEKYKNAKNIYINTVSDDIIGVYKNIPVKKIKRRLYQSILKLIDETILKFIYNKKITKSNKLQIKICKIPVYSGRVK